MQYLTMKNSIEGEFRMRQGLLFLIIVTLSVSCFADTLVVDLSGAGDYPTIQSAIDAAVNGDAIIVAEGVYKGEGNRDLDFKGKKITVESTEPERRAVVIDCQGSQVDPHRAFYFHSSEDVNSIVNGFTIKNGYAEDGGGVLCDNSSPTIINCNFVDCVAENWGGGINCYNASPFISNCKFTGNSAFEGGAITTRYEGYPIIRNCQMFDNIAVGSGGGINCDVLSSPAISNCLITNNYAGTYGGGGISIFQSNPVISNCTIVGNTSDSGGSGVLHWYEHENGSTLKNCIVWDNLPSFGQILLANSAEMTIDYCDTQFGFSNIDVSGSILNWGIHNIDQDPLFEIGLLGKKYYLSQIDAGQMMNSPCLDSGSESAIGLEMNIYTTRTDQMEDEDAVDIGYHYSVENIIEINIADINRDDEVNIIDFSILASQWGQTPSLPNADISPLGGNNIVDLGDLEKLCQNWLWSIW